MPASSPSTEIMWYTVSLCVEAFVTDRNADYVWVHLDRPCLGWDSSCSLIHFPSLSSFCGNLTNAKTRRGKHVIRAIKYSKLKRTRCMRFWHLETKTCKAKHKLVQWDNRSGEKLQGFTKTSEDRQQTMQSLIMKGSCERVRLEGIRGVRVVWE